MNFKVEWSEEDKEYVGTCDEYPFLSWISPIAEVADIGIKFLVANEQDIEKLNAVVADRDREIVELRREISLRNKVIEAAREHVGQSPHPHERLTRAIVIYDAGISDEDQAIVDKLVAKALAGLMRKPITRKRRIE